VFATVEGYRLQGNEEAPGAELPGFLSSPLSRELMDALKGDSEHCADVAERHVVSD
jgi:hypothetical protein